MKNSILYLTIALAAVSAVSCKSQFTKLLASYDENLKYQKAFEYFDAEKYAKAAQLFESVSISSGGTAREDTVLYYWGLSNYKSNDFVTAETNFSNFVTMFPSSPFVDEAAFYRIDCMYKATLRYELDQKPTHVALEAINEYLASERESHYRGECEKMITDLNGRLDRKAYESAKLYYKMEDYLAARTALRNVLKDNSDNIYREDILYYTCMSSYKFSKMSISEKQKDRYMEFVDDYLNFIGEFPESIYRKEIDAMYHKSLKELGRYSGTEDDLEKKEKDFERERKILLRNQEAAAEKKK